MEEMQKMKEKKEVVECYCNNETPLKFVTVFKKGSHLYAQQGKKILSMRIVLQEDNFQNHQISLKNALYKISDLKFQEYCATPRSRVHFYRCMRCGAALKLADLTYCWKRIGNYVDLCPQCTQDEVEKKLKAQTKVEKERVELMRIKQMRKNADLNLPLKPRLERCCICNTNNPKVRKI